MVASTDGRVDGDKDKDTKGLNYLTPYLRIVKDPKLITREEAMEVRQTCLDALRARLVERANIIQVRMTVTQSNHSTQPLLFIPAFYPDICITTAYNNINHYI